LANTVEELVALLRPPGGFTEVQHGWMGRKAATGRDSRGTGKRSEERRREVK